MGMLRIKVGEEWRGVAGIEGPQGEVGPGLEYNWSGTSLGVRIKGDASYTYTNLVGPTGPQGPKGDQGVVSATSPIIYNASTQNISINDSGRTLGGTASGSDNPLAVGPTANVDGGFSGIAIGEFSYASGEYPVSLGAWSNASADATIAIGYNTNANHAFASAVGTGAQTSSDNEGVLGGSHSMSTNKWRIPGTLTVQGELHATTPTASTHAATKGYVDSIEITAGDIPNLDAAKITTGTIANARLPQAATNLAGIVQLNDSIISVNTNLAATSNAVRLVNNNANSRVLKSGDSMTGLLQAGGGLLVNGSFDGDTKVRFNRDLQTSERFEFAADLFNDGRSMIKLFSTGTEKLRISAITNISAGNNFSYVDFRNVATTHATHSLRLNDNGTSLLYTPGGLQIVGNLNVSGTLTGVSHAMIAPDPVADTFHTVAENTTRLETDFPNSYPAGVSIYYGTTAGGWPASGIIFTMRAGIATSSGRVQQVQYAAGGVYHRNGTGAQTWGAWKRLDA